MKNSGIINNGLLHRDKLLYGNSSLIGENVGYFCKLALERDTIDPLGKLNGYSIVRESMATYIDPSGKLCIADGDSSSDQSVLEDETGYTYAQGWGSFVDDQAWFSGEVLGSEALTDGTMETDPTNNWTAQVSTLAEEAVIVRNGSKSLKCTLTSDYGNAYQNITVTPGTYYKVIGYVTNNAGDYSAMGVRDVTNATNLYTPTRVDNSAGWKRYCWVGVVPAGCTTLRVFFQGTNSGDVIYGDDFSIKPVTSISTQSYSGNLLALTDSAGKKAYGYIGAAEGGEEVGLDLFDANKGTFTEASLLEGELFTDGDCSTDSFTSTGTWAHDAGNEEYDADGSQVGVIQLYQTILGGTAGLYKLTYTVKNYSAGAIQGYIGSGGTAKYGTGQASNGTYTDYLYNDSNTRAGVSANDTFVGSVDDLSVQRIDISWVPYGTNTMEIDSNALKITYVDDDRGAHLRFGSSADLSSNLTVQKQYKLTGQAKVSSGSVEIDIYHAGVVSTKNYATISSTSFIPFEIYFTSDHATGTELLLDSMDGTESIWLDSLVLTEVTSADAQAVTVYKEPSLLTEGYAVIQSGFDYNDASMTFDVYSNIPTATGAGAGARIEVNGLLNEGAGTNWLLGTDWSSTNGTDLSAASGDCYLRHDGSSSDFRLYVNAGDSGATSNSISSTSIRSESTARSFQAQITNGGTNTNTVRFYNNSNYLSVVSGEDYSISFWIKTSTSLTIPITINRYDAPYTNLGMDDTFDIVANTWTYITKSFTATSSSDGGRFYLYFGNLGTFTVNVECFQFEHTPYATSWIPTTTIPVARTAETQKWTMSTAFKNLMGNTADSPFTMVVEWTPKFSYTDIVAATYPNILYQGSSTGANQVLGYLNDSGYMGADDGPNSSTVDINYVSGTTYLFALRVYLDGTMKFEVGASADGGATWSWDTSPAAYDGSFNPATYLQLGYSNIYPFNVKNIIFYDKALSQAQIEGKFGR